MSATRPIAVAGFAQLTPDHRAMAGDEGEVTQAVTEAALLDAGIDRAEVEFVCSGSCDYVMGKPFAFVTALDGVGAWPPLTESHVEMDGAWALYEAWVHLQMAAADVALVYCFGKSSLGDIDAVLTLQLDPYYLAPLRPSPVSLAALQARALLDAGRFCEADLAQVVADAHQATDQPARSIEQLLAAPHLSAPLRAHDAGPHTDGAAAVVLVAGDRASNHRARITGMDHRIEPHALGLRDLTSSPSIRKAAQHAGVGKGPIDLAEIHAPYSPQVLIAAQALGLDPQTRINPSGGALVANPPMVAGLARIGEAALAIRRGEADRALGHATSGPCLQQNLVCLLEAQP